ncbi:MAG: DUF5916 domain-containing protein [Gemmatimonadaceae bacterium]
MRPSRFFARSVLAVAALVAQAAIAGAQSSTTDASGAAALRAVAQHRTSPVVIDGRLDEAAWAAATPITTLRQYKPTEGAPASLATDVRILYDDRAIYVGARLSDPLGRAGIRAPRARRDQLLDGNGDNGAFNSLTSDKLVIQLDPFHNHLDEALFEINPAGVRGESFNGDDSWDPVWEVATHVDSGGWTAELRIPYSQLRFSRDSVQRWGLQVWRYVDRLNERDMWSFRRQNESSGPAFYGHLDGIRITSQPRQVEVMPYAVARSESKPAAPGDPFHSGTARKVTVGGDLKYLLTTNLTLDATVNPDFGQVEVDPSVLNLSASETYYDEKRPFFVAGSSAFHFGGASCMFCNNMSGLGVFYSRRIGRPPQLADYVQGRAAYVDMPDNTAILGAAKVTGRTRNGYAIGVLDALTDRETASFIPSGGATRRSQLIEPRANYFVARVKKDFNEGATTFGGIVSSTLRQIGDDSIAADRLRSRATAIGADWVHTWARRNYRWMGSVVASDVGGTAQAIAQTQRSSVHYFQRPDRRVIDGGFFGGRYDTTATVMRGWGLYTRVAKEGGNWLWELAQNWRSPGFEVNDASYVDRTSYRWMNGNIARQWVTPTRWYRNIAVTTGAEQQFNWDGLRTFQDANFYFGMELPNYWRIRTFVIHQFVADDDRLTRGGPVVKSDGYTFGHAQLSTDPRQMAVFDITVRGSRGVDERAPMLQVQPGLALKPMPSLYIQLAPSYNVADDGAQYVTTVTDPTAAAFGGKRYVFSYIRTRTLSLETRVNWTFTPALTLQLYAQPFFASGDYQRFREFAAPRTLRKLDYGRDVGTIARSASGTYTVDPDGAGPAAAFTFGDPNFAARSLRGTAVLRWEYRPGSTVYFAWTQQRAGVGPAGSLDLGRDQSALWRDPADNVFLVKMNYWLGR